MSTYVAQGRGDRWRFGAVGRWGMQAKEGMSGEERVSPLQSHLAGYPVNHIFTRNRNMGRSAGFFPLTKADGDQVCWGWQGPSCSPPRCCKGAGPVGGVLPPPAAGAALSLSTQAVRSWGLPREPTCCSVPL